MMRPPSRPSKAGALAAVSAGRRMTAIRAPGNFSSVRIGFNVETALDSGGLRALRRLSDALKMPAIICMWVPWGRGGAGG